LTPDPTRNHPALDGAALFMTRCSDESHTQATGYPLLGITYIALSCIWRSLPVTALSSAEAMPSTTSLSAGMRSFPHPPRLSC
jgi:hypothetical protein